MLRKRIKVIFLVFVGVLLIDGFVIAADKTREYNFLTDAGQYSQAILTLTNEHRESLGLNPLATNPRLTQAAVNKARDMFADGYFAHTSPDGRKFSQWIKDINYNYFYAGENLAIDFSDPQAAFDAWLKSDKHRENIERKEFQEIGIAGLRGEYQGRETWIAVQLFGSRVLGANELSAETLPNGNTAAYFAKPHLNPYQTASLGLSLLAGLLGAYLIALLYRNKKLQPSAEVSHFDILSFTAQRARPTVLWPTRYGNTQKYLKSDYSNISTRISKTNSRQRAKTISRITLEANQLHRRKSQ